MGTRVLFYAWGGAIAAIGAGLGGCSPEEAGPPEHSAQTLAVEEVAGDFLDYYEQVLKLARRHSAHPDSFQIALDSLPGSHLSEQDWESWTAPYRDAPGQVAEHLEVTLANLSQRK